MGQGVYWAAEIRRINRTHEETSCAFRADRRDRKQVTSVSKIQYHLLVFEVRVGH